MISEKEIDDLLLSYKWEIQDDRKIGWYKNTTKYGYRLYYNNGLLNIIKKEFTNLDDYSKKDNFRFTGYVNVIELKLILKIFEENNK